MATKKLLLPIQSANAYESVPGVTWLAEPWIVRGAITEIVGTQKEAGKTTWVLRGLVKSILAGEPLLGKACLKASVLYLSEQPPVVIRKDLEAAGLLHAPELHVLQWHDIAAERWPVVAGKLRKDVASLEVGLVVIDTFAQFALAHGESENDSSATLAALRPAQLLTKDNVSVLLVRHERKVGGSTARAGRGSTAFGGGVDIMLRIRRRGNKHPTHRVIQALSRFAETPEETIVQLTDNGYAPVEKDVDALGLLILKALADAQMTMQELIDHAKVPRASIMRTVKDLEQRKLIVVSGGGKKGAPFKYGRAT